MSLIAWYKLNGNLLDSSGNGNHGLGMYGNPTFVDGIVGKCLSFDGIDDYLDLPANPELNTDRWTISMWVNISATTTGTYLITPQSDGHDMSIEANTVLKLRLTEIADVNNRIYQTDADSLVQEKWNLVTIVLDDTVIKLYINGILQKSVIDTGLKAKWSSTLKVGTRGLTGTPTYFKCLISDIRIYDHCLSDKEIYELSKAKVLHYTFDDVEEPTTNLIPDGNFIRNNLFPFNEGNKYGMNISVSKVGDEPCGGNSMILENISSNEAYTSVYHALSTTQIGETWTFSGWYRKLDNLPSSQLESFIFGIVSSGGAYQAGDFTQITSSATNSKWNFFSLTWTIKLASSANVAVRFDVNNPGGKFALNGLQLEKKDHATPFVNGTRDNIVVRDLSDYENDSLPLTISTTPALTDNCKLGTKALYFDGNKELKSKKIFYDNINQQWTCCGWVNILDVNRQMQVFNNFNLGNQIIHSTTQKALLYLNGGINDSYVYSTILPQNQWIHLAYVLNSKTLRCDIYVNGYRRSSGNYESTDILTGFQETTIFGTNFKGYMDDVRIYARDLSSKDILEIYQSRANLDDKGNLKVGELVSIKNKKRIMDYSWWNYIGYPSDKIPQTNGESWSLCGTGNENRFVYDLDPFGKPIIVWRCQDNDTGSNDDGGWNTSMTVDNTKKYRFSIWVKRSVVGNGTFYLGCSNVHSVAGVDQNNPYWHVAGAGSANGEIQAEWQLFVYYIFPKDYTGAEAPDQGVYKVGQGKVHPGSINRDCASPVRWHPNATDVNFRAYLFYSTDATTKQEFCYPRIDLCDGTEPTIDELLNGYDSRNYDLYMKKGNVPNVFDLNEKGVLTTSNISEIGVTEGLIAHYPLNGDARDYSGNGNDGTVVGATIAAGLGQKCYYFAKSVNERIIIPTNPIFDTKHLSIQLWVKPNDVSSTSENNFLCKENQYEVKFASGELFFAVETPEPAVWFWVNTGIRVNENEWVNFYFKYNAISFDVYKNGVFVVSIPHNKGELVSGTGSLQLGNREGVSGSSNGFKGSLQDVRIYNRPLSPEEIKINYDMTRPDGPKMKIGSNGTTYVKKIIAGNIFRKGVIEGLIAHYPLDGDTMDYSGNENHGTLSGAIVVQGQGQKCYSFDGIDDKILATLNGFPGGDTPHTISFWINVAYLSADRRDPITLGNAIQSQYSSIDLYSTQTNWYNYTNDTGLNEPLPLNQWVMVTLTYSGGGAVVPNKKMYWNSVLKNMVNTTGGPTLQIPANPTMALGFDHGRNSSFFNGKIQDVRIYNRALTPEEVKINYDLTRPNGPKVITSSKGKIYFKERMKTVN